MVESLLPTSWLEIRQAIETMTPILLLVWRARVKQKAEHDKLSATINKITDPDSKVRVHGHIEGKDQSLNESGIVYPS
jgi:hypothetical protein